MLPWAAPKDNMRIEEVETTPAPNQLMGLVNFLAGRAENTNGPKQIDQATFIELADNLGIKLSPDQLVDIISKPPLSNVLEPLDPNTGKIMYKGAEQPDVSMPVDKAQDVVANAARQAMKKDRGV